MSLRDAPPAWLTARPIAHRGLHDRRKGRIENSLSAAAAAMAQGFAIECDVQRTQDGEAVVFHDFGLERLTGMPGRIADLRLRQAEALCLAGSSDRVPSWVAFLDRVAGAVPIVCEIKSRFDGDMRLADRIAATAATYPGPLAIKSFDPAVIIHLRSIGTRVPLGIVSEASFDDPEWNDLPAGMRRALAQALHFAETRPDFLSYHVDDLPHAVPYLGRNLLGTPVMAWTVRTPEQRRLAVIWADQMVFEGFLP